MKITYILILLLFVVSGCKTVGNKNIVGDWELIEFRLVGQGGNPVSNEETLRKAGAVWDMNFKKNGEFKQNFNMRKPGKEMEVEEGTWKVDDDTLSIELEINTVISQMDYTYKLDENILTLTLAPEEAQGKIITKFRKK